MHHHSQPAKGIIVPSRSLALTGRLVHIWPVRIEPSNAMTEQLESILAPDEKARAARFRFEHLRHSFILAHGALRVLLGCYLDVPPASIQFQYGPKGKPSLGAPAHVNFNASHSGGLVVFAFTRGCELGVDVEQIRPLPDMQDIAARFFCPEEAEELMSLPTDLRKQAFFLCWTRKEAYVKAIGDGLSVALDSFQVTLRPGEPANFVHLARDVNAAKAWALHDLQLNSNYAAAVAYCDMQRPLHVLPPIGPADLLALGNLGT